jgi:16S rRNA processing protein RimM
LAEPKNILLGKISGAFGIKGWVKVMSHTDPKENIFNYSPWWLKKGIESKTLKVSGGKLQGQTLVAHPEGLTDRDQAAALAGWEIWIASNQLPPAKNGEYYWSDLIGLKVENLQGDCLGQISGLLETGANDVVIVKGERARAIPFLQGQTVLAIDLAQGVMKVDWDSDF